MVQWHGGAGAKARAVRCPMGSPVNRVPQVSERASSGGAPREVDARKGTPLLYWLMKYVFVGWWLRLLFRPWVQGIENIPDDGPAILASNHLSFSDSVFLPLMVDRQITFLAKSDYFTGKGIKGRLIAWFVSAVGQVPVDRTGGRASEAAIYTGLRILGEDKLLGIYPEGTRSPDGRLYRGKTGVARMALEAKVPIIPVAMINTRHIQPPGKLIPRIARVGIRIGTPLSFARYEGMEDDRFVLRSVTDELMYELMELSGQEYVDVYASRAKAPRPVSAPESAEDDRAAVPAA